MPSPERRCTLGITEATDDDNPDSADDAIAAAPTAISAGPTGDDEESTSGARSPTSGAECDASLARSETVRGSLSNESDDDESDDDGSEDDEAGSVKDSVPDCDSALAANDGSVADANTIRCTGALNSARTGSARASGTMRGIVGRGGSNRATRCTVAIGTDSADGVGRGGESVAIACTTPIGASSVMAWPSGARRAGDCHDVSDDAKRSGLSIG
jgi:hypothetical protein